MPFGELYYYWGTIPTDKRFTGQQREQETDPPNQWNAIYDYGARMYDAKIGRMLQPDAFYDPYNPQSLNRYSYVLNNPTTYTDPTGNYFVDAAGEPVGPRICASCGGGSGIATPVTMEDIGGIADVLEGYNFAQDMWATYCVELYACNPYSGAVVEDALVGIGLIFEYYQLLGAVGRVVNPPRLSESSIKAVGEVVDTANALERAATRAGDRAGPGQGGVHGTKVHTLFKQEVQALGNPNLRSEVSFGSGGREVAYGTKGSIRIDAVLFDTTGRPIAAFELKTGGASLGTTRVSQIQSRLGPIPVIEIRP